VRARADLVERTPSAGRTITMELAEREFVRQRRDEKRHKAAEKETERAQRAETSHLAYARRVGARS
jgi:hypothetical protein